MPDLSLGAMSARDVMKDGRTPASANTARQRDCDELAARSIKYSCVRVQLSDTFEKANRSDLTSRVT